MRLEKLNVSLPVTNHDDVKNNYTKHGPLFGGSSKRGLLVGASGCGKTNVMVSLLEHPNGLRFENIYLYSKSLYQPKYEYLRSVLKPMKEIGYFEYNEGDDLVAPHTIKPNSIVIFDDVATCNQNIIRDYFCFGRHKSTDAFYLCQTYSSIPKQLIRDNSNMLIVFHQDNTNLKHIYDDHVNVDMSFQQFKELCTLCWYDSYGFVVIDKDCPINAGRYKKNFDSYIKL